MISHRDCHHLTFGCVAVEENMTQFHATRNQHLQIRPLSPISALKSCAKQHILLMWDHIEYIGELEHWL